jgi:hypothetical protein
MRTLAVLSRVLLAITFAATAIVRSAAQHDGGGYARHGTIKLASRSEHVATQGSFMLIGDAGDALLGDVHNAEIHDGMWTVGGVAAGSLSITRLIVDGKPYKAISPSQIRFGEAEQSPLELLVEPVPSTVIEIVDSGNQRPIAGATVIGEMHMLYLAYIAGEDCLGFHPASSLPRFEFATDAKSPVTIDFASTAMLASEWLWVHAAGCAWTKLSFDPWQGGRRTIALPRGGSAHFTVPAESLATIGRSSDHLKVRFCGPLREPSRFASFTVDIEGEFGVKVEGLAAGEYACELLASADPKLNGAVIWSGTCTIDPVRQSEVRAELRKSQLPDWKGIGQIKGTIIYGAGWEGRTLDVLAHPFDPLVPNLRVDARTSVTLSGATESSPVQSVEWSLDTKSFDAPSYVVEVAPLGILLNLDSHSPTIPAAAVVSIGDLAMLDVTLVLPEPDGSRNLSNSLGWRSDRAMGGTGMPAITRIEPNRYQTWSTTGWGALSGCVEGVGSQTRRVNLRPGLNRVRLAVSKMSAVKISFRDGAVPVTPVVLLPKRIVRSSDQSECRPCTTMDSSTVTMLLDGGEYVVEFFDVPGYAPIAPLEIHAERGQDRDYVVQLAR